MAKIRVLIVDDSVVIRRILTDVLSEDPSIEVVGAAPNGKIALQKIPQVNPDIITLDVEMPEMTGIETLRHIRKTDRTLPVIMFSTLTERGASATMDALAAGASDYVTKPANVGSVSMAKDAIRKDLGTRIHALCRTKAAPPVGRAGDAKPAVPAQRAVRKPTLVATAPKIVTIGVSTGGPNALTEVIPLLPADFPVPIVIVQHMPPVFTKLLADRLSAQSHITVLEGSEGMVLKPGHAYIAPGDYHMEVVRSGAQAALHLQQGQPENSCRPAVDVLFRSVVAQYAGACLGVVLTGMGQDGLRGAEYIKDAGGQVITQDEATSVVWGMPGAVTNAGLSDKVLPITQIASEIRARVALSAMSMLQRGGVR